MLPGLSPTRARGVLFLSALAVLLIMSLTVRDRGNQWLPAGIESREAPSEAPLELIGQLRAPHPEQAGQASATAASRSMVSAPDARAVMTVVDDETGMPIAEASISLLSKPRRPRVRLAVTDAAGMANFRIPTGRLVIEAEGYAERIVRRDRDDQQDFGVQRLTSTRVGFTLSVDVAGRLDAQVEVRVERLGPDLASHEFRELADVLDGRIFADALCNTLGRHGRWSGSAPKEFRRLPPGDYLVACRSPMHGCALRRITGLRAPEHVELELVEGPTVRLIGVPSGDVRVELDPMEWGLGGAGSQGGQEIRNVLPGTYRMTVHQPGLPRRVLSEPLVVPEDPRTVEVRMPSLARGPYVLRGRLVERVPGGSTQPASGRVVRDLPSGLEAMSDGDGRFSIAGLAERDAFLRVEQHKILREPTKPAPWRVKFAEGEDPSKDIGELLVERTAGPPGADDTTSNG